MSDFTSILPSNASDLERTLESLSARLIDVADPLRVLWSIEQCPPSILPWLAWSLSVDGWDSTWSDEKKRSVIRASVGIHRRKGTVASVRAAIVAYGFGEPIILEGKGSEFHDAEHLYDGSQTHGVADQWAEYRVILKRPITIEQAAELRAILAEVAPVRSFLKVLQFTTAANRYNSAIAYDGTFAHGAS